MKRKFANQFVLPVLLLAPVFLFQHCTTTNPTSPDSTAPGITWTISSNGENISIPGTINTIVTLSNPATTVNINVNGTDNESGTKTLHFSGKLQNNCLDGSPIITTILKSQDASNVPDSKGMVATTAAIYSSTPVSISGCSLYSGEFQVTAVATNSKGLSFNSNLSVTFKN